MDNCKKCGAELRKTNKIISVVEHSEASKNLSKGDIVVSVDEKNVKSLSDIEKAISENKTCKITIMHDDQRKTVSIEAPIEYFKSIEFESENVCFKCGAKQKSGKGLLIGIILGIVILGVIVAIVVKTSKPSVYVDFGDEDATSTDENYGSGNMDGSSNTTFNYNGKQIVLNNAGQLPKNEKDKNIEVLNAKKESNTGNKNPEVFFDDEDPVATTEDYGSNSIEKSYSINPGFDIRSATITGYTFANMSGEKLRNLLIQMSKTLGTIYIPYGFPKEHEMNTSNVSLDISVRNILANIPQDMLPNAKFLISGHTDTTYYKNEGTDRSEASHIFNKALSERRAEYVKQIMIGYGIKPESIVTEGHSFDNLTATPDDARHADNQKLNRRVEIKVAFDE